jgi:DNA-binding MarR family transcriptional regulator
MAEAVRKSSRKRGEDSQQPKADAATDDKGADKGAVDLGILGESVGFLLKRAQMAVFADFIETFTAVDLRPAQFSVLVIIGRNPGLKQSQVSAALNIKRTNFVPLLDSLEERGLVARKLAAGDRRSHALHLTAKGSTLLTELHRLWADHEQRICEQIGTDGREQLLSLLGRMIAAGNTSASPDDADEADATPAKGRGRRKSG